MDNLEEIRRAIRSNDLIAFKRIIATSGKEMSLSMFVEPQRSLLNYAVYSKSEDIVHFLIHNGVVPNIWESSGGGLVKYLRQALADNPEALNARSFEGWTPLHLAATFGQVEAAKVLLDAGADVLAQADNRNGDLPIGCAVLFNHLEVVRLFVSRGCPVDVRESDGGLTPLFTAAQFGHIEIVKYLLSVGADPAIKIFDGPTALDAAKEDGHQDLVDLLTVELEKLSDKRPWWRQLASAFMP